GDDDGAAEPAGGGPGCDHHRRQHEQHGDCGVLLPVPGGVGGARPSAPGRRRGRAVGQPLAARRRGGRLQRRRLRRVLGYCMC
uniref:Uncharacterized protein n=1 Tax=Aegilops tauschii subsp. strangulata TaxID=200361 RepID=A0A453J5I6_AEGTS